MNPRHGLLLLFLLPSVVLAQETVICKEAIFRMSRAELCQLFRSLPAGEVPRAYYQGTFIGRGPASVRHVTAGAVGLVWQGKYVLPEQGQMINKVCGKAKVTAQLFQDASWLDGCPTTVFDYQCSSAQFARDARDEVRPLGGGLFLGVMWLRQPTGCPKLASFFLLERACGLTPPVACETSAAGATTPDLHAVENGSATTTPSQSP